MLHEKCLLRSPVNEIYSCFFIFGICAMRPTELQRTTEPPAGVGGDIRALRLSRAVTLADLAGRIGRSVGWLSQVERGLYEPGIPDLRVIAGIFDIPISFFFRNDTAREGERGIIVRKMARATLGSRRGGLVEQLLSPHLSGDFEMIRSEFQPRAKSRTIAARPSQEGGYLVTGQLLLTIGPQRHALQAGDSFQFQNQAYAWENPGEEPAVAIWIISPPIY